MVVYQEQSFCPLSSAPLSVSVHTFCGGDGGGGDGGEGDGGGQVLPAGVDPPPQAQHMEVAVKTPKVKTS